MNPEHPGDKKEKIPLAAALKYDGKTDAAPRVTAKGRGEVASRIIEKALLHGVPVKEDSALVQFLYRLDVDEEIPVELYRAIAEILAFVYSLDERRRDIR
ncbi:MAG: EscU/YscU/HrcU family type III secretion system export apparatus switch protein [Syntrophales bacterium]